MNESKSEADQLLSELRDIDRLLMDGLLEESSHWSIGAGRFRVQGIFSPNLIAVIFLVFNSGCLAGGIVFSLLGGTLNSLGISLVVGSVFAMSAFIAQLWTVSYQRSRDVLREVFGDDFEELKNLAARRAEVVNRITALARPPDEISINIADPERTTTD